MNRHNRNRRPLRRANRLRFDSMGVSNSLVERLEDRRLLSATAELAAANPWGEFQAAVRKNIADKLDQQLTETVIEYAQFAKAQKSDPALAAQKFVPSVRGLSLAKEGIVIEAVARTTGPELLNDLRLIGLTNGATMGNLVNGVLPASKLAVAAQLGTLGTLSNARYATNAVYSQGDVAMNTDDVRAQYTVNSLPVNGAGIKVGIISDTYNLLGGASGNIASGDLPTTPNSGVHIGASLVRNQDGPATGATDEGRAMAQIVFDVAPGAQLLFASGFVGQIGMANAVGDLMKSGADIIVDDVIYASEPFFTDGFLAVAAEVAKSSGVPYVTAAGNFGNNGYFSGGGPNLGFVDSGITFTPPAASNGTTYTGGRAHDFDPGAGTDIRQTLDVSLVPNNKPVTISFQWANNYKSLGGNSGAVSDLNIYVIDTFNSMSTTVAAGTQANIGLDPIEVISFTKVSGHTYELVILKPATGGPNPEAIKYIAMDWATFSDSTGATIDAFSAEFASTTTGTIVGHANAVGAIAVGAARHDTPGTIEAFSSLGGTPIYTLGANGYTISSTVNRAKPDLVGPDGVNNTFFGSDTTHDTDGNPNFFGTSAAAPHVAGTIALMRQYKPTLTPEQIFDRLKINSTHSTTWGYGFVNALTTFSSLTNSPPPGIFVSPVFDTLKITEAVSPGPNSVQFWVQLITPPPSGNSVAVFIAKHVNDNPNRSFTISPNETTPLVFTASNWSTAQSVTVTVVNDFVDEANDIDGRYRINTTVNTGDPTYAAINPRDVWVEVVDDDPGPLSIRSGLLAQSNAASSSNSVLGAAAVARRSSAADESVIEELAQGQLELSPAVQESGRRAFEDAIAADDDWLRPALAERVRRDGTGGDDAERLDELFELRSTITGLLAPVSERPRGR